MRRTLITIAVAGLALAACGSDSPPKAFPGSAVDKARELVRRQGALGLPHGNAESVAIIYKTVGDGFCADKDPEKRDLGFPGTSQRERATAVRQANLVVEVYCPWLSRFR